LPPRRKPKYVDEIEFEVAYSAELSTYKLAERFGMRRYSI
jgi:hypothetical protein